MPKEKVVRKKVVVIGDGGSGRTSLLIRYTQGIFSESHVNTVFQTCMRSERVGKTRVEMALWITAAQDGYEPLREVAYQDTDVAILCFALDNPYTFDNVKEKWVPEIKKFCPPNVKIVLVGNRTDLADDPDVQRSLTESGMRPVSRDQGSQMAHLIGAQNYIECSARTGEAVREVFFTAAKTAITKSKGDGCVIL